MQNTLVKIPIVLKLIDLAYKSTFHYARLVHQSKYTTTRVNTKIIFNTPQFLFFFKAWQHILTLIRVPSESYTKG